MTIGSVGSLCHRNCQCSHLAENPDNCILHRLCFAHVNEVVVKMAHQNSAKASEQDK